MRGLGFGEIKKMKGPSFFTNPLVMGQSGYFKLRLLSGIVGQNGLGLTRMLTSRGDLTNWLLFREWHSMHHFISFLLSQKLGYGSM
jgi:hypothetical protein